MTISNIYYSTLVRIWDMGGEMWFLGTKMIHKPQN